MCDVSTGESAERYNQGWLKAQACNGACSEYLPIFVTGLLARLAVADVSPSRPGAVPSSSSLGFEDDMHVYVA